MPLLEHRTYGPTHLTLDECRESSRPTIVQSLAAHVYELQQESAKLRQQLGTASQTSGQPGGQTSGQPAPSPTPPGA